MKRYGFSLLEVVMVMALTTLLLGLAAANLRTGAAGANSRGLATVVAAELRQARQQAISTQQPVAVIIPTRNGTMAWSQGVYVATGESVAHITRAVNFGREQPGGLLFMGVWPLASGALTTTPPTSGDRAATLNLSTWLPASMQSDYAFVFTPSGGVVTLGLPMFDGAYHLVACAGGSFAPGSPFFSPTSLGRPWTVTLDASGEVSLSSGLLKQDGSVSLTSAQSVVANANPLPAVTALGPSTPVLQALAALPAAPPGSLPPGADLAVTSGSICTLAVNATDLSGRDLYVNWSGDGGNFTFSGPERMVWDAEAQLWTSRWQWSPPVNMAPGDVYHVNCSLGDGTTMQPVTGGALTVHPTTRSTLVWTRAGKIRMANGDGSGAIELETPVGMTAAISPDGSRIVADLPSQGYQILTRQGKLVYQSIPNYWGNGNQGSFSPDGRRLLFSQMPVGMTNSYVVGSCDLKGTNITGVDSIMGKWWQVARWSPDQTQVLFMKYPTGALSTATLAGPPGLRILTNRVARGFDWQPNSPWIYYTSAFTGELFKVKSDATGDTQVSNFAAGGIYAVEMSLSPDGNRVVFVNRNDGNNLWTANVDGTNPVRITTDGGNAWPTWGR